MSEAAGKSMVHRERVKVRPRIPADMHALGLMLDDYLPSRDIYRGMVTATDDSHALIFGSLAMINRLNDATEIIMDGTFKVK